MKFELKLQLLYTQLDQLCTDITKTIKDFNEQNINDVELQRTLEGLEKEINKQKVNIKKVITVNIDDYNVIDFLNKALKLEYNSIFDYQTYVPVIDDPELKEKLSRFGMMEMEHARLLGEKIERLGGTPLFNPPEFRKRKPLSIEEMLKEHQNGEHKAIALFDEGLKKINDPELTWFIGKLRLDEQEHLKEIGDLLKGYKDLKKIITVSSQVKWRDDYAGNDKDRPWIDG